MHLKEEWKRELSEIVGENHVIDDPALAGPYTDDFTDHYKTDPIAVVRPKNTEELSQLVLWCEKNNVPLVVQGGNTGLTGAASTFQPNRELLVCTRRMNKVVEIDPINKAMAVEAGMTLADVQEKAADAGFFFPLSFAAEGNATIGGCLACNAGGVAVLRYGMTRDLVLGLEVVLPDGRVWNGMRSLRKDNTGYDLKNLFIGSEGTLGIISKVVLKLFPKPEEKETAFVSVENPKKAAELLALAQSRAHSALTAFELISKNPIGRVVKNLPDVPVPPMEETDWRVLMELSHDSAPQNSILQSILEEAFEKGLIVDAALAQNQKQQKEFWHVRESIPLADRTEGGSIHSDVSLPISLIPEFLEETSRLITVAYPWIGESVYGHLGDGNIHYNFVSFEDPTLTYKNEEGIREILYSQVNKFKGSISAEHGIGQLKLDHNYRFKDPLEMELMKKIKDAFDPKGLFNPGKLIR